MRNDKHPLGRGLSAIFEEMNPQVPLSENIVSIEIPLQSIRPNPDQPRKHFEPEEMQGLIASIEKEGVLQPILVRVKKELNDQYEIIAGERRWRAAQHIHLEKIPAIVLECDDLTALQLSLIENMQRHDLSPLEEAASIKTLMDKFNKTQAEVATMLSKSRSYIANVLRLLRLPENVQDMLQKGDLSVGHARALLDTENAEELAQDIVQNKLSVRDVEQQKRQKKEKPWKNQPDEDLALLEKSISDYFGLKSRLSIRGIDGGGSIQLFFSDYDELDKFLEKITGI